MRNVSWNALKGVTLQCIDGCHTGSSQIDFYSADKVWIWRVGHRSLVNYVQGNPKVSIKSPLTQVELTSEKEQTVGILFSKEEKLVISWVNEAIGYQNGFYPELLSLGGLCEIDLQKLWPVPRV